MPIIKTILSYLLEKLYKNLEYLKTYLNNHIFLKNNQYFLQQSFKKTN